MKEWIYGKNTVKELLTGPRQVYEVMIQNQSKNDDIVKLEELSYADYLNKCNSFIYGDDLDKYIESLSIGNDTNVVRYKMLDESGNYQEYVNNIIIDNTLALTLFSL